VRSPIRLLNPVGPILVSGLTILREILFMK